MTNSIKGRFFRIKNSKITYSFHPHKFGFANLCELKEISQTDFDKLKKRY